MQIDRTSRRILGSLLEKRWTTPEQYPLTMNALVLACNQKSNRDPEMQLEDFIVQGCVLQLRQQELLTVVERDAGRTTRYAERMSEKLDLSRQQQAIVAELMLRGPQTVNELHRRCERMAHFENEGEVENLLRGMSDRGWARLLPRESGQRHARWTHLLAPPEETPEPAPSAAPTPSHELPTSVPSAPPPPIRSDLEIRLAAMQDEIDELRARIERLGG
jgi:uncharacterized protein YceH (UPF0502 family)